MRLSLAFVLFPLITVSVAAWSSQSPKHHGSPSRTRSAQAVGHEAPSLIDFQRRHFQEDVLIRLHSSRQPNQQSPLTKLSVSPISDYSKELAESTTTLVDDGNFMVDQDAEYQRGLAVIMVVTFIFAGHSPLAHAVFSLTDKPPPVLLVNAGAAISALCSLFLLKPVLESTSMLDTPELSDELALESRDDSNDLRAGFEMGLFKTFGATLNFYGLSLTSATHGAFLVQLTTLFVPVIQGLMGVPITKRMWTAVGLAMTGVLLFTQGSDGSGDATLIGDGLCVASALFLGAYDLSLNRWGDKVPPVTLITNKIASQAILSSSLLLAFGGDEIWDYIHNVVLSGEMSTNLLAFVAIAVGNGLLVNAGASLLQVRAQNAIGATTAQVVYATQPLISAMLSYAFLHETIGAPGVVGGAMFLGAVFLAGNPEPDIAEEKPFWDEASQ
ncbi:EamA-like transporter family [Seminavis robusta]|uniref:EamA-like transporter family n=1 Tax=Seminavis robusta TaxID=568900 RepID=A0A9N8HQC2_9STRA|nr:EamA-like transporter family [Seminavis robusta]|eukprot:Sro1271_g258160.1 EamA-like transporter family (442) ;mRNA; f:29196-30630